jgi:hypothetical protein
MIIGLAGAALLVILIFSLVVASKYIFISAVGSTVLACVIYLRWKKEAGEGGKVSQAKVMSLVVGVLAAVGVTALITFAVLFEIIFGPGNEAMEKGRQVSKIFASGTSTDSTRTDPYTAAIAIAQGAKHDEAKKRLTTQVLDHFRGADSRGEQISPADLQVLETFLEQVTPRMGGRYCSLYYPSMVIRKTGPADVYQVLTERLGESPGCHRSEYILRVTRRCATGGQWHAQCKDQLPRQQLESLLNDSDSYVASTLSGLLAIKY